jgi:hypothetical protein
MSDASAGPRRETDSTARDASAVPTGTAGSAPPAAAPPAAPKPTGPPPLSPAWEKFKALSPLLQAFVTAVAGVGLTWYLTGRVTNAIQMRQLELSNVKEMHDTFLRLETGDSTRETAHADALALASFRDYSIVPLLLVVERGQYYTEAAKAGLRAVALTDSTAVAKQLLRVVTNRSKAFSWQTHNAAIELLGELAWRAARPPLEADWDSLGTGNAKAAMDRLTVWTSDVLPPTEDDITTIRASLQAALAAIPRETGR